MHAKHFFWGVLLLSLAGLLAGLGLLDEGGWPLAVVALIALAALGALAWGPHRVDEIDTGGTGSTDDRP